MNPGELIGGRFRVERFVARGGMGVVYRALDESTGRPVALKVPDTSGHAGRWAHEVRALVDVHHPGIVRYVAHDDGERPFLAMEWIDGVTLAERIRREPLSVDDSLAVAQRIADALAAVHERGIVHRDLKPHNVMLAGGQVDGVRLLDFGLARVDGWSHFTRTGGVIGTPNYMAPEQARGAPIIGPPADVFALGCILYECVTGHKAFGGDRVEAVLAKLVMLAAAPRVSERRPDVPRIVDELAARLMAPIAAARPCDGAAAVQAIRSVRRDHVLAVSAGQPPPPVLSSAERHPVSVLLAVIAADELGASAPATRDGPDPLDFGTVTGPTDIRGGYAPGPVIDARLGFAPHLPALQRAMEPYGARVELLLDGSLVAMLAGGAAATDLAVRSARCALAIRTLLGGEAAVGIATRQAIREDRRSLDGVIDAAAALVRPRSRQIWMDRSTRELLPPRFEVAGEAEGFELRVEKSEEPAAEEPPRLLLGKATPCVGRERQLRQLMAAYEGTAGDRVAQAIVVIGPAGAGKSRVRAELVARLRHREAATPAVMSAWGDPVRAKVTHGLVARGLADYLDLPDEVGARREVLRTKIAALVAQSEEGERERVAEFLGELCGTRFPEEDSPALRAARRDPELMADQVRRAFGDFLAAACEAQPLVLVVDDLQWADQPSVDLIGAALKRARDLPLLVLAFGRPDAHDRFPQLADKWGRQEIALDELRPAACESMVRVALGEGVDEATRKRLVERSAGNPFYLEEMIRAVAAGETALPETVVASAQLRIGRLAEAARQVLRAASIYGRMFWAAGVRALLGGDVSEADVAEWLVALETEEMVVRTACDPAFAGQLEYSFRHDLVREAAYVMLTDNDRMTGHRLAGRWLQEQGEDDAIVLAEHFAGGGAAEEALEWFARAAERALANQTDPGRTTDAVLSLRNAATCYRRAGETATASYANDSALGFFERAVALWSPLDPVEAARTRLLLAAVRERVGQREDAIADVAAAEGDLREADPEAWTRAMLQRANLETRGQSEGALDRARALAESARDVAARAGRRDAEAQALTTLAVIHSRYETSESLDRAVRCAERALALQRSSRDISQGLWRLGNMCLKKNQLDRALLLYRDALASAEEASDDALVACCLGNMGMLSFRQWRLDEAIERAQRALAIHHRVGHRIRITEVTLNLGVFHLCRGDMELARTLVERALALASGDWVVTNWCQEALAELERQEGNERRAQELLANAAALCGRVHAPQRQAFFLGLLAESCWATGELQRALEYLEQAITLGAPTLSHALLIVRMANYDEAEPWLELFRVDEMDPHRRVAATLALARIRLWRGSDRDAATLCGAARAIVAATDAPRVNLPIRALSACVAGDVDVALKCLSAAREVGSQIARAEVTLDVATLVDGRALTAAQREAFLAASQDVGDFGVRYRIEDIRARVFAAAGDAERARECLRIARSDVAAMRTDIPPLHQPWLDAHPWVHAVENNRAVDE